MRPVVKRAAGRGCDIVFDQDEADLGPGQVGLDGGAPHPRADPRGPRREDEALGLTERGQGHRDGSVRVVSDAASCSEGLAKSLAEAPFTVEEAVPFTVRLLLPRLRPRRAVGKLALHPTCSWTRSGANDALHLLAAAVADEVYIPPSRGCRAFAVDRGRLHPELTRSATARQAEEVRSYAADAHASCNRTCELGMTWAAGAEYGHILTLLEEATR